MGRGLNGLANRLRLDRGGNLLDRHWAALRPFLPEKQVKNRILLIIALLVGMAGCAKQAAPPDATPSLQSAHDQLASVEQQVHGLIATTSDAAAKQVMSLLDQQLVSSIAATNDALKQNAAEKEANAKAIAAANQRADQATEFAGTRTGLVTIGAICLIAGMVLLYLGSQIGVGSYWAVASLIGGATSIGIAYFMPYGKFVGMAVGAAIIVGIVVGMIYLAIKIIDGIKAGASAASLLSQGTSAADSLVKDILENPAISKVLAKSKAVKS